MKKVIHLFLFCFCLINRLQAQSILPPVYEIKTDTALRQNIDIQYWQMLEDKEGDWTIDNVSKLPLSGKFHFEPDNLPGYDTIINTRWFRYRLKNVTGREIKIGLSALTEESTFYLLQQDSSWISLNSGLLFPWEKKDGLKFGNCIPVTLKPDEELLVYQRIYNKFECIVNPFDVSFVNIDKIIRDCYVDFIDKEGESFFNGKITLSFTMGFLFFASFFNFFFYSVTKEKIYLYFTFYVFFYTLNRFNPIALEILYWGHPEIYNYIIYGKYVWSLAWIFLFLFFRYVFKINKTFPTWDKILLGLYVIYGLSVFARVLADLLGLFKYVEFLYDIYLWIETITMEAIFVTLIVYMRKPDEITRQVIIGAFPLIFLWAIFSLPGSGSVFKSVLNFPNFRDWLDKYSPLLEMTCTVWFVLFFSWYLFIRYNQLRKEISEKEIEKEKMLKQNQEEFTKKLIESQEEERKRIASALHDTIAHDILLAKSKALLALRNPDDNENLKKALNEISDMSSETINDVRGISYNLHPHQLERLGFSEAIESIIKDVSRASDIEFSVKVDNVDDVISKEAEINLYRVIQEGINNIIKHSKATEAELKVIRLEDHNIISISDNGRGIDSRKSSDEVKYGFGLSGIAERVKILKGEFKIESDINNGTVLRISVPFSNLPLAPSASESVSEVGYNS